MPYPNMPPDSFATDEPYLTTLAYCIQQRCQDEDLGLLENFWKTKITLNNNEPPFPKWSYQETLATFESAPTVNIVAWAPFEPDIAD